MISKEALIKMISASLQFIWLLFGHGPAVVVKNNISPTYIEHTCNVSERLFGFRDVVVVFGGRSIHGFAYHYFRRSSGDAATELFSANRKPAIHFL